MKAFIVAGTDTGVGKTVVSAMLTLGLDGAYWKPIQSGTEGGTDRDVVTRLTGLPSSRFLPERYRLRHPLSPHHAAELDGIEIDPKDLHLPRDVPAGPLIVEGAGGVLVPITRTFLQADLFARWRTAVILVSRTSLGTINHTLLSLEALQRRSIPVLGVVFVGESMPDSERTIVEMGGVRRIGRLPILASLTAQTLGQAFMAHFSLADFEMAP